MPRDYLFVYGTLRHGARAPVHVRRLLGTRAVRIGDGWMRGRLFDIGPYPGAIAHGGRYDRVRGDVYRVADTRGFFARLDRYEGCSPDDRRPHEYERTRIAVVLRNGARIRAWVYLYRRPVGTLSRIRSGDYLRRRNQTPAASPGLPASG